MRRDLQHIKDAMETGAKAIAEKHFNPESHNESAGLMHLGNEHIALPSFLLADPVLEMVDKGIYSTIRLLTPKNINNSNFAYPTYNKICKVANVGSHATVARALAILRITRWLTSKQVTSNAGVVANVYITHDQPLDIIDMEMIDDGYMEYVTECLTHSHNRVNQVAQTILTQYENDMLSGKDLSQPTHHLESIVDANSYLNGNKKTSYFGLTDEAIEHLRKTRYKNTPSSNIEEPKKVSSLNIKEHFRTPSTSNFKEQLNKPSSKNEEPISPSSSIIEEPSSSCSSLNITTTTKKQTFYISVTPDDALNKLIKTRFNTLKHEQHYRIGRLLMRINTEDRESMIYEVSNRIRYGSKAIPNPVGYIGRLCGLLKNGEYPFSDFSFPDYQQHGANHQKQKSPEKQYQSELATINNELSSHWAELKSLESMQATNPNEVIGKSLERTQKKLQELSERKRQLSVYLETK
jgi:hypothetical protein